MKEENMYQQQLNGNDNNESDTATEKGKKVLDEKVAELKARLFMEVPESAGFTIEQTLVVRDIILKAVNEAVEIGQIYPALCEGRLKEAADNMTKMFEKITNPSANIKAESLSKLYHIQRYVTNNLITAVQAQHTIAGIIESEGEPFKTPIDLVSSIFEPNPFLAKKE